MTTELSPELRQALQASPDGSLELIDPETNRVYVLVSAAMYERVQSLLDGENDAPSRMQHMLADLAPEDWESEDN